MLFVTLYINLVIVIVCNKLDNINIFEIVLFTVILCETPSIFLKLSLLIKLNTLRFEINEIGHTSLNKTGIQIAKEKLFGAFFIMKRITITAIAT